MLDEVQDVDFHDRININAYTQGVANESLVTQVGNYAVIHLGGGNTISVWALVEDILPCIIW
nr:hypothetical protein [Asticcacaulis biprosthecium]